METLDLAPKTKNPPPLTVGWREWASLPGLAVPALKVKIDTGARTSALHVVNLESYRQNGKHRVRFVLHPIRRKPTLAIRCNAEIVDRRQVSDSGGHRERRYVIESPIRLGDQQWMIEITLTDRENMLFRMLLGRRAMHDRLVVDPSQSYTLGRALRRAYSRAPTHPTK